MSKTDRQGVIQFPLPLLGLGQQRAPLVGELGHLPPDGLVELLHLVVAAGGAAAGAGLGLARHCGKEGGVVIETQSHNLILTTFFDETWTMKSVALSQISALF